MVRRERGEGRQRRRVLIGVAIGLVAVAVLIIVWLLGRPSEGVITQSGQSPQALEALRDKAFEGSYIRFSYPGRLGPRSGQKSASILERFDASARDPSTQLHVAVYPGSIEQEATVRTRRQRPEYYREEAVVIPGLSGRIFTAAGTPSGYELVAFLERGSLLATVSYIKSDMN